MTRRELLFTAAALSFAMLAPERAFYGQDSPQKAPPQAGSQGADIPPAPTMETPVPVPAGARVVASPQLSLKGHAGQQAASGELHRDAVTITLWDLNMLLRPAGHALACRAVLTVRNDGPAPMIVLPLQISSSLQWQSASQGGKPLAFTTHPLDTGLDHTAAVSEALITLPSSLAAGASTTVQVLYEGTAAADATRLMQLGAPEDVALHTDWDRVDAGFTGLRGEGNVVWYPIAAEPVLLGDGARLFTALDNWRARHAASEMHIRLRVDTSVDPETAAAVTPAGPVALTPRPDPETALLNGQRFRLRADESGGGSLLTAEMPRTALGGSQASLFLAGSGTGSAGLQVYPMQKQQASTPAYATALELVRPTVEQWLAAQSRDIAVTGLPEDQDAAFETAAAWNATQGGPLLAAPMPALAAEQIAPAMAHLLARASFVSPRRWLAEGVAEFMATLWVSHTPLGAGDINPGLELLEDRRSALALAEPGEGPGNAGEPLMAARSDIYYRTKAAYVLWMLRGICGDQAVITALKAYKPQDDNVPEYFEHLLESASHADLRWFFADWVYADKGLPDLKISNVISRREGTAADSWFVSIDVQNDGYASAEVPVRVAGGSRSETVRLLVPGRGRATAHLVLHAAPETVTVNDGATPETGASVHVRRMEAE